jgi:hypothetical protein
MTYLTDKRAKEIQRLWRRVFPDASIFPVVGFPSNANGVMTLTHTANTKCFKMENMRINGLKSNSPLANNALFSTEITDGRFLNLYEIMLPDLPGKHGKKSTVQYYIDHLQEEGIQVSASHYHWTGVGSPFMLAIHSYSASMSPECFVKKTIQVLQKTLKLIDERMPHHNKH